MADLLNSYASTNDSAYFGWSAFYITDDPTADEFTNVSQFTKCSEDFHEGGFKKLTNCKGRYLILRRTGSGMQWKDYYACEIRVFTVTNLLEGAAVIEAPAQKDQSPLPSTSWGVNNLIEN